MCISEKKYFHPSILLTRFCNVPRGLRVIFLCRVFIPCCLDCALDTGQPFPQNCLYGLPSYFTQISYIYTHNIKYIKTLSRPRILQFDILLSFSSFFTAIIYASPKRAVFYLVNQNEFYHLLKICFQIHSTLIYLFFSLINKNMCVRRMFNIHIMKVGESEAYLIQPFRNIESSFLSISHITFHMIYSYDSLYKYEFRRQGGINRTRKIYGRYKLF